MPVSAYMPHQAHLQLFVQLQGCAPSMLGTESPGCHLSHPKGVFIAISPSGPIAEFPQSQALIRIKPFAQLTS